MGKIIERLLQIRLPPARSAFLWGPRKVGKTYWIHHYLHKNFWLIDLLKTDVFAEYASRPALLRERWRPDKELTVVDEVQKIPALLDEVHWLIENKGAAFILTGSSARKLRRGHANLLAGRAWRYELRPLSVLELEGFNLDEAMVSGMVPPHYLSTDPLTDLRAYVADYLREEIAGEALTRNIPAFSDFLSVAALTSSELLNYTNIARECGVSAKVARSYFEILEDTLLGFRLQPWRKANKRRLIQTEKFYFFDVGVANYLAKRHPVPGNSDFGKSFEQFVLMELMAYKAYNCPDVDIRYWRTSSGQEVDFILNDMEIAVEVKATSRAHEGMVRGLRSLRSERSVGACVLVCLETEPRIVDDGVEILPWRTFIERLWAGDFRRY